MKIFDNMIFTKHFLQRYCERVLNEKFDTDYTIVKELVINDMISRMTSIEKKCLDFFNFKKNKVSLPFSQNFKMIIKNRSFITIY